MPRGRLAEYHPFQAAKLLHVTDAQFTWARHAKLIPPPDASETTWLRATVEAMNAEKIARALPQPVGTHHAAGLIAAALGTPNPPNGPMIVKAWTVERFVRRGLLTRLGSSPTLLHPMQVERLCRRKGVAGLVAQETPLGPEQAAVRLGIRRADFDHVVRLGWVKAVDSWEVQFGTSKAGAVDVPIYRSGDVDAIPRRRKTVDWEKLRGLGKGQRSPLAKL